MTQDRKAGRPPAGKRKGEHVRDYPPMTLRLPVETRALLKAWSDVVGLPVWRIVDSAVLDALKASPDADQRKVRALARRDAAE